MKNLWMKGLLLAAAVLAGGAADAAEPEVLHVKPVRPLVQLVSDVVYAQVPQRGYASVPMTMDLLLPPGEGPHPAIIYITGGGFLSANKDNGLQLRMDLAEAGYAVASITYRTAPLGRFPEPLEDVKSSIRYLRAHGAAWHIDPDRIGVLGGSAGGYLAAMAGVTNGTRRFDKGENLHVTSDVQAAAELYGVTDLTKIGADYSAEVQRKHQSPGASEALWVNGSPVFGGVDGGVTADPAALAAAQPATYISENTPPFLIMHGDQDQLVSPSQARILAEALEKKGVPVTRYVVHGAAHGGPYWVQPEVEAVIRRFFDEHLKK